MVSSVSDLVMLHTPWRHLMLHTPWHHLLSLGDVVYPMASSISHLVTLHSMASSVSDLVMLHTPWRHVSHLVTLHSMVAFVTVT